MLEEIKVIFEDDDLVVINKPAGILVHGDNKSTEPTVVDWLEKRYPDAIGVGETQLDQSGTPLRRSGVVHRLDRDTSGVLVLAKNQASFEHLKNQFQDRLAQKEYRAFVYGAVRDKWGTIDKPIGRNARDGRLRSAQHGAKGVLRDAVTHYERIVEGQYEGELFSYLKLTPKTGRTHQIRVHLKAIDRPIVQDELYSAGKYKDSNNLGLSRLALHAHILELETPAGAKERFIAPVPMEFEEAAERIAWE
ncbi:RluA family pseudouridine synthase [Candidatus Kaiserbacteria bacterium]|nr:RluA family pseudouridine synthase [Candidatus Kaiserbacteria bacterium]